MFQGDVQSAADYQLNINFIKVSDFGFENLA